MSCANHLADPSFQIGAGSTGPVDCTAHACSNHIDHSTCGAKDPGGRTIRLQTDEPIPDPKSPGLNLVQVARVAGERYGVYTEVRTGTLKVTWTEYERRRKAGQSCIVQVDYGVIADSKYDAGRGFRGGHAMTETLHATYDPLADGRAPGVFRHDGTVYDRAVMKRAAGNLVIGQAGGLSIRVGQGYVWAAFGRDVVPDYRARVPAGVVLVYSVVSGRVTGRDREHTGGFSAKCSAPKSYPWPARGPRATVTLVKLLDGSRKGAYISQNYSKEV
jgi:hypothetical protein